MRLPRLHTMSAPQKVNDLVELFERNAETYRSPHYNQAAVRQEFINPFFKSLGWDMDNEKGYDEAHKQVIHEAAIKVGGVTKAPDYCFRLGGTRDSGQRQAIAKLYAKTVKKLVKSKCWNEMPPPEDQLPDDFMPKDFFQYWSPDRGRS